MSELVDRNVTTPESSLPGGPADLRPGLVPETPADRDPRRSTEPLWRSLTHGRGLAGAVLVGVVVLLGSLIGLVAGIRGYTDVVAQRVFDVILAFPALVLAIALTAVLGPGVRAIVLVIVLAEIPVFGRLIRTSVLRVRELPYVEAAVVSGASTGWVLRKHVLPNSIEPLGVQLALSMSVAVFIEGAMSFLGIGVVPPTPSLGSILSDGNRYLETNPLFAVGPLVVVSLLTLGFLLISQAFAHARRL